MNELRSRWGRAGVGTGGCGRLVGTLKVTLLEQGCDATRTRREELIYSLQYVFCSPAWILPPPPRVALCCSRAIRFNKAPLQGVIYNLPQLRHSIYNA